MNGLGHRVSSGLRVSSGQRIRPGDTVDPEKSDPIDPNDPVTRRPHSTLADWPRRCGGPIGADWPIAAVGS